MIKLFGNKPKPSNKLDNIYNTFLSKDYQNHNVARLSHLESLDLDLKKKSVIEFGSGIGDHTYYYLIKNCKVLATDARQDILKFLENRFQVKTMKIDVENDLDLIPTLGQFDIIHCYGLLYHINNPKEFLEKISSISNLLLLETCVSDDYHEDDIHLVKENRENPTQSFGQNGCRPTRKYLYNKLKELYKFVYIPKYQPKHPEFPLDWNLKYSKTETNLIRAIFIGSNQSIENEKLLDFLPKVYEDFK